MLLSSVRAYLLYELAASILISSAGVVAVVVEEEDVAATMTGVAEADTVTGVASGTTLAAHMFEVIIVTAVERTEAGLREGMLPLFFIAPVSDSVPDNSTATIRILFCAFFCFILLRNQNNILRFRTFPDTRYPFAICSAKKLLSSY